MMIESDSEADRDPDYRAFKEVNFHLLILRERYLCRRDVIAGSRDSSSFT